MIISTIISKFVLTNLSMTFHSPFDPKIITGMTIICEKKIK